MAYRNIFEEIISPNKTYNGVQKFLQLLQDVVLDGDKAEVKFYRESVMPLLIETQTFLAATATEPVFLEMQKERPLEETQKIHAQIKTVIDEYRTHLKSMNENDPGYVVLSAAIDFCEACKKEREHELERIQHE